MYLLQAKLAAYPELEPSLVETTIGEEDASGGTETVQANAHPVHHKPVQRSLSDRYSYRAAIFQNDRFEYDII